MVKCIDANCGIFIVELGQMKARNIFLYGLICISFSFIFIYFSYGSGAEMLIKRDVYSTENPLYIVPVSILMY